MSQQFTMEIPDAIMPEIIEIYCKGEFEPKTAAQARKNLIEEVTEKIAKRRRDLRDDVDMSDVEIT